MATITFNGGSTSWRSLLFMLQGSPGGAAYTQEDPPPPPPPVPTTLGIDVAATVPGIHVAYRVASNVLVATSLSAFNSAPTYVLVATDAEDSQSIPTIEA